MNDHKLYSKFKINFQDYEHYNTYFVKGGSDKVYNINNRLLFIENMLRQGHPSLSDNSILQIIKSAKKDLILNRRILLIFGLCCMVAFYFGIQYMKPTVGVSIYYDVLVVGNNPWDFILIIIIMLAAWYYEKVNYKKNLLHKIKDHIIAGVEDHYAELNAIQKAKEARKQSNRDLNKKRKKRK